MSSADADVVSVFIYSELDEDLLGQMDKLRMVATRSTGFDHVDADWCDEHDVKVCNVPAYGENTVAEHVFALLLTLSHHIVEAVDRTRRGDFSQQGLRGFDLRGKTLGVVGTGDIGQCVIEIAGGFGMRVLAFDVQPDASFAAEHDLEALLADHVLLRMRNVIITPHSAFNTKEAIQRILDTTVDNIAAFDAGEPQNVVAGG